MQRFYSSREPRASTLLESNMTNIPGIVLAGGKSSRMGRPKALLPIGSSGETFFDRVKENRAVSIALPEIVGPGINMCVEVD